LQTIAPPVSPGARAFRPASTNGGALRRIFVEADVDVCAPGKVGGAMVAAGKSLFASHTEILIRPLYVSMSPDLPPHGAVRDRCYRRAEKMMAIMLPCG
jgi:hypothetical protein